jgi:membrane dipeptidase
MVAAPMMNRGRYRLFAGASTEYCARTVELVRRSTVIDMLGLLSLDWKKQERWFRDPSSFTDADFRDFADSGITVFNPAVDLPGKHGREETACWFADWNRFLDGASAYFVRVTSVEDIARAKSEGKVGVMLGFQNSVHFESARDVAAFHESGQRVSQLTYNGRNRIGQGCTERSDAGLTRYGAEVVRAMNAAGMAIDVSHVGDRTTLETIEASEKPVLVTHANCRALVRRHPRCKPDEAIRRMAAKGGVMGVTGIRVFAAPAEPVTLESVLRHFDHIAKVAGVEHAGIGSDTDLRGRDHLSRRGPRFDIAGLNHPRRVYDLTQGLIRRKYNDADIVGMLGGNFLRALREIWIS